MPQTQLILAMCSALLLATPTFAQPPLVITSQPVLPGVSAAELDNGAAQKRWSQLADQLQTTRMLIEKKQWQEAAQALQQLLEASPTALMPVRQKWVGEDKESIHWHSPHAEANALLAKLSPEGLAVYRKQSGPSAAALLKQAQDKKDSQLLTQVVQRYQFTEVGQEALQLLAEQHQELGRLPQALACYDRLLQQSPSVKALPKLLTQACKTARLVGDQASAEWLRKRLQKVLENDPATWKKVEAELEGIQFPPTDDWPLLRGNAARNGLSPAGMIKVKAKQWARPTIMDKGDFDPDPGKEAKTWIDQALKTVLQKQTTLAPGAVPIAIGDLVMYRTYYSTACVALQNFQKNNESWKMGEIYWKSTPLEGSLAFLLSKENLSTHTTVDGWLRNYYNQPGLSSVVFDNELLGTLSAMRQWVYVVDDLAVPPPVPFLKLKGQTPPQTPEKIQELMVENNLLAFSVGTGKLEWASNSEGNKWNTSKAFRNSHWLGAPLPLGNALYALNEKNDGTLQLLCLEPATGKVVWTQILATVREKFQHYPHRRTQASHLAYHEGVLLCPTNAGTVLAFDLVTQTLRWAHTNRLIHQANPPQVKWIAPNWRASAPILHEGRVIYAAPEDDAIHCWNLRDGQVHWRAKRAGEHYVAGVLGERVLLVGQNHCRALRLKDGSELWKVAIDQPTGLGVLSVDGLYTLPVRGQSIALWTIDTAKGQVVERQALKEVELLGNLIRHRGRLLSQSVTDASAYSLTK